MPATIWDSTELSQYVQEGYDALTLATGCLWATWILPDRAFSFNYTSSFELDYFGSGQWVDGPAQFTALWERDYVTISSSIGPANHNYPWEFNQGYVTAIGITTEVSGVVDLPEDLYEIERATWNTYSLDAIRSRDVEVTDSRYEIAKGYVDSYIQDKDGLRKFRKWRVPAAAYTSPAFSSSTHDFGILRDVRTITDSAKVINNWGDIRSLDGQTVCGGPWGIVRAVYTSEAAAVRIEYRRRGKVLTDEQDFEIAERYEMYVRHYAQARALEREGEGQELELAAYYQSRYDAGVQRMLKRKEAMHYQQKRVLGGGLSRGMRPARARLPWPYPREAVR